MDEIEKAQDAVAEREESERLTDVERETRDAYEAELEQIDQGYIRKGEILADIKQFRLHKETHSTFEAYCRDRWDMSRTYVYNTIRASQLAFSMENVDPEIPRPQTERQARELVGLAPEQAARVMERAHGETDGNLTAKAIKGSRAREVPLTEVGPEPTTTPDDPPSPEELDELPPRTTPTDIADGLDEASDGLDKTISVLSEHGKVIDPVRDMVHAHLRELRIKLDAIEELVAKGGVTDEELARLLDRG